MKFKPFKEIKRIHRLFVLETSLDFHKEFTEKTIKEMRTLHVSSITISKYLHRRLRCKKSIEKAINKIQNL